MHMQNDRPLPATPDKTITSSAGRLLRDLVAFDTRPNGTDHERCATWLSERLGSMGFDVRTTKRHEGPPALMATRQGLPGVGTLVMYGHYDVEETTGASASRHPPLQVQENNGRWFGPGVADDKGPLACRLAAIEQLDVGPTLVWLIQGEEETGSRIARTYFPRWTAGLRADAWLDETGYHNLDDDALRLIACNTDAARMPVTPDGELERLLEALESLSLGQGRQAIRAIRRLNKHLVPGGCPFQSNLPPGARYLALGVNDTASHIHQAEESVPIWSFETHKQQLQCIWNWMFQVREHR